MKTCTRLFAIFAAFFIMAVVSGQVHAQATRTWVSGVGDDANPCSRTAPCKTWAGAISKTATGGEIDALDPGGFGAVTITKSITLDGGGGQVASLLVSGTPGTTVAAPGGTVIFRNLRFNGLLASGSAGTTGINITTGAQVHIQNCDIFGFNTAGVGVSSTSGTNVFITDSRIVQNTAGVTVNTASGGYVRLWATNSHVDGNTNAGFSATPAAGTGAILILNNVTADGNGTGVSISNGGAAFLGNSEIIANNTGVSIASGSAVYSYGNNQINGNGTDISGTLSHLTTE